MVKVYRSLDKFIAPAFPVVTIGTFDGVHIGHTTILSRLNQFARQQKGGESVLLTFWPHPRMVLQPEDNTLRLLNTMDEKIERLEKAGLENLVILPFSKDFSRMNSIDYIRDILVNGLKTRLIVVGYDHQFGKNREGSLEELQECAPLYNFKVEEIPPQKIDDNAVSSTKIRNALLSGDIHTSSGYLGYDYFLNGTIVKGQQYGREMGFPTANIHIAEAYKLIPADGVYFVKAQLESGNFDGMMNIGERPTVQGKRKSIEVHLLGFDQDIYNQKIRIDFLHRLRDEIHFPDTAALKRQLEKDKEAAISYFNSH
jgi:riboflavin kinase / FMN adenylyltransferase